MKAIPKPNAGVDHNAQLNNMFLRSVQRCATSAQIIQTIAPIGDGVAVPQTLVSPHLVGYHFQQWAYRYGGGRVLFRNRNSRIPEARLVESVEAFQWFQIKDNHESIARNLVMERDRKFSIGLGDRILLLHDMDVELLLVPLAASRIGASVCVVPYHDLTPQSLSRIIELVRPTVIITKPTIKKPDPNDAKPTEPQWVEVDMIQTLQFLFPDILLRWTDGAPRRMGHYKFVKRVLISGPDNTLRATCNQVNSEAYLRKLTTRGQGIFNTMVRETEQLNYWEDPLRRLAKGFAEDTPLLLLFDGAVHKGKLSVFNQSHILNSAFLLGKHTGLGVGDTVAVLPGCQWTAAGWSAIFACQLFGAVLAFPHEELISIGQAKHVVRAIDKMGVTCLAGTAAQFDLLCRLSDAVDRRAEGKQATLQWVMLFLNEVEEAGPIVDQIKHTFGISRVEIVRGSPETGGVTAVNGKVVVEAKVVDTRWAPVPNGTEGLVVAKGPSVTPLYHNYAGNSTAHTDGGFVQLPFKGKLQGSQLHFSSELADRSLAL